MAYPASNRFDYWGQLGLLAALVGAGLIFSSVFQILLLPKMDFSDLQHFDDKLYVPENAARLRISQFLSTATVFFVPTLVYASICHRESFTHIGFKHKTTIKQAVIVIIIMLVGLQLFDPLTALTGKLPFSKATFDKFKAVEAANDKHVEVIGRMNNFSDYLVSLFMLGLLPAVFEETLFRGGIQNLLSRWWKRPIPAIIITSIVFSTVHGSYLGFLGRVVLGFILGWMYYRTGNLWLNIIAHGFYNGTVVTLLYLNKLNNPIADLSKTDLHLLVWTGLLSVITLYGLFILFEKVSKFQVNQPGKEVLL
jgi:membrane protease YdiL (CAAX protease family)